MNNIAIITARSGSKGLKDKNIRDLNGKPLIAYSIDAAIQSGVFQNIMVSTDSEKYAEIAREYGAEVPFLRSKETSGDTAGSWDVIKEVLKGYKMNGMTFDSVCLLQPTSPLRMATDIVEAYELFDKKQADAVTGVCECEHPAEYMIKLDESLSLEEYRKNEVDLPRQLLPTYYRINGAVYIRRVEYEREEIVIKNEREYAYIMDRKKSVDIDTIEDFEYAEFLLARRDDI